MEAMLVVFFGLLVGWVCFALFFAGIAGLNDNWREEEAFYEYLRLLIRVLRASTSPSQGAETGKRQRRP